MLTQGIVLGHLISPDGIKVDPTKIQVILNLPVPCTQKEVHSFIGYVGYYRRFVQNVSKYANPLFLLMSKNKHLEWSNYCQLAWETLKQKVSIAPILRGPNWSFPFLISTDASDTTLGGVIGQQEYHKPYAIYFISKNITVAKLNYTVTEKEFMTFIYAIK